MRGLVPFLVALAVVAAGCTAEPEPEPTEIVVRSQPLDVHSNDTSSTTQPSVREPGQLIGVVVDSGIRPIEGAIVRLPGLDLVDETNREGVFAFPDLVPSVYFLTAEAAGYRGAETTIELGEGKVVRIRFVLEPIPPPSPYHTTTPHTGYCDVSSSSTPFVGSWWCWTTFPIDNAPTIDAIVIEAAMDPYDWTGTANGNNSFGVYVYDQQRRQYIVDTTGPNPVRVVVTRAQMQNSTSLELSVEPHAFPLPESNKEFRVFVTAWHNSEPPPGWSFIRGDP